jgi:hypothetical protein
MVMKHVNQFQTAADIHIEQYQLPRNNHHSLVDFSEASVLNEIMSVQFILHSCCL